MKLIPHMTTSVASICLVTLLITGCGGANSSSHSSNPPPALNSLQAIQDVQGNYTISWAPVSSSAVISVEGGASPTVATGTVLGTTTGATVMTLSGLDSTHRWYFDVSQQGGAETVVAARYVPLKGTSNFRDLGGYPTADGRHTKWGVFFRSDALNKLTAADVDYLANSGIKLDIDFRDNAEVQPAPDILASDPRFTYIRQTIDLPAMAPQSILAGGAVFDEKAMAQAYELALDTYAAQFAGLFQALADQGAGSVFHCSYGKDRTGLASALLLMAANVPDAVIVNDYSLTEQYEAVEIQTILTSLGTAAPLFGVACYAPPAVMQEVLKYIRQKYGSAGAYLQSGGLDPAALAKVLADFVQ